MLAAVDLSKYDVEAIGITRDGEWVRADDAIAALRPLGPGAAPLRAIADYVVARVGFAETADAPPAASVPPIPLRRAGRAPTLR